MEKLFHFVFSLWLVHLFPSWFLSLILCFYFNITSACMANPTFRKLLLLLLSHLSRVRFCATPETAAHQAPLYMGFSRQEYWSGALQIYFSLKKLNHLLLLYR